MESKDRNRRAVNLKWVRFEHRWMSFHPCSLSQPYQSRRKSVFKKYCWKVKDCERVIDVNKITTNPRQQRANELQNKITFKCTEYCLDPMFHDQWQKEKNECRIYPPSPLPWNRHSKVRGIFIFKRLQKFFFYYGKQTISSLLRLWRR